MKKPISIYIVDDNRLLREGLASMLDEIPGFGVVGSAETGSEALKYIKEIQPDVAIVDIGLPDKDGLDVTQSLRETCPDVKVIILGMPDLTNEIMACIEAGASGYMLKEASFDTLVETIRAAHRGDCHRRVSPPPNSGRQQRRCAAPHRPRRDPQPARPAGGRSCRMERLRGIYPLHRRPFGLGNRAGPRAPRSDEADRPVRRHERRV